MTMSCGRSLRFAPNECPTPRVASHFSSCAVSNVAYSGVREPVLLGLDERLDLTTEDGDLLITLPQPVPVQPAYAIRLGAEVKPLA